MTLGLERLSDGPVGGSMSALLERRFRLSTEVPERFFEAHVDRICDAGLAMARRFEAGGRLLVFGAGAQASDAAHVAVEFVHPVLVGKRALPAMALPGESEALLARLSVLGRAQDIAMGIHLGGAGDGVTAGLALARSMGLLTLDLAGGTGGTVRAGTVADFRFVVPTEDALAVQETHETLYHVLWELVHLFFEQSVAR